MIFLLFLPLYKLGNEKHSILHKVLINFAGIMAKPIISRS